MRPKGKIRIRVSYGDAPLENARWKQSSAGWPDPTDWVNRLCAEFEGRYAVYCEEPDPTLRRNKAASMLAMVLLHFHELPPFQRHAYHMPLKDLMHFLNDLDHGRATDWARPTNFGGTNVSTSAETELQQWANAAVHLLYWMGLRRTTALKHVAKSLTNHGRKAKDGGPLSWRTVQSWSAKHGNPNDTIIGDKVMRWWQAMPCPHGQLMTNCDTGPWNFPHCIHGQESALKFIADLWDMPHLRDRI